MEGLMVWPNKYQGMEIYNSHCLVFQLQPIKGFEI